MKMNAGLCGKGDKVYVKDDTGHEMWFTVSKKCVVSVPDDTEYCTVNGTPKIDFREVNERKRAEIKAYANKKYEDQFG